MTFAIDSVTDLGKLEKSKVGEMLIMLLELLGLLLVDVVILVMSLGAGAAMPGLGPFEPRLLFSLSLFGALFILLSVLLSMRLLFVIE